MLVTKPAKTVTNISKLLPKHFVSNISHQHRCNSLRLEPYFSDGYAQADMELEMMGGTAEQAISGVEKLQLSQFEVHKHDFLYRLQKFATGSYPRLSLQFLLKRNIGYFLLQTYMPCSLITILRYV